LDGQALNNQREETWIRQSVTADADHVVHRGGDVYRLARKEEVDKVRSMICSNIYRHRIASRMFLYLRLTTRLLLSYNSRVIAP
jgi:hypothetical protein